MEEPSSSFRDRLVGNICSWDYLLYVAFIFEVVLLLFALLAFFLGDLDTETQTILYIDFILLGIVLAATIYLISLCNRHG